MLTLIKSPFLEYKLTILRNKKTTNSLFRQTMNEISYLIAAEVLKHVKYKRVSVQTPLTKTFGKDLSNFFLVNLSSCAAEIMSPFIIILAALS